MELQWVRGEDPLSSARANSKALEINELRAGTVRSGGLTRPSPCRTVRPVSNATELKTEAPATEVPVNGTRYDRVRLWKTQNLSRAEMIEKLKADGLDEESALVLINSVMGAMPSELPSAQLTVGRNVLSPGTFTLSDLGLTGPAHIVGLYWMGFGAAILLALGLAAILNLTGLAEVPDNVSYYAVRLGGVASMACVAWGVVRYSQGVTIRRRD